MQTRPRGQRKVTVVRRSGYVGPGWGNGHDAAVMWFTQEAALVFAIDLRAEPTAKTVIRATVAAGSSGGVRTHLADMTVDAEVAAMVAACIAACGRINILVNNVGGAVAVAEAEAEAE